MIDLRLSHYANTDGLPCVRSVVPESQPTDDSKPRGLWVSVDGEDDWPSWCRAKSFGLDRLARHYRVHLSHRPRSRVVILDTAGAVRTFAAKFGTTKNYINWRRVARKYHGIVIAPYLRELRFDEAVWWYYGWDCASGCIWNRKAIAGVEELAPAESGLDAERRLG